MLRSLHRLLGSFRTVRILLATAMLSVAACSGVPGNAGGACETDPDLSGWMATALADSDVVVFGEIHGTQEVPQAFLGMVCAALASERNILVGLEVPPPAIGWAREHRRTGSGANGMEVPEFWLKAHDGRTSVAMFELVDSLLTLEDAGRIQLVGYDMRVTGREAFGPSSGAELARVQSDPHVQASKLLVLTGRGHAAFDGSTHSLAEYFYGQGARALSIDFIVSGGSAWICRLGSCGVSRMPVRECSPMNGLPGPLRGDDDRRSANVCLGQVSASPPTFL